MKEFLHMEGWLVNGASKVTQTMRVTVVEEWEHNWVAQLVHLFDAEKVYILHFPIAFACILNHMKELAISGASCVLNGASPSSKTSVYPPI